MPSHPPLSLLRLLSVIGGGGDKNANNLSGKQFAWRGGQSSSLASLLSASVRVRPGGFLIDLWRRRMNHVADVRVWCQSAENGGKGGISLWELGIQPNRVEIGRAPAAARSPVTMPVEEEAPTP